MVGRRAQQGGNGDERDILVEPRQSPDSAKVFCHMESLARTVSLFSQADCIDRRSSTFSEGELQISLLAFLQISEKVSFRGSGICLNGVILPAKTEQPTTG